MGVANFPDRNEEEADLQAAIRMISLTVRFLEQTDMGQFRSDKRAKTIRDVAADLALCEQRLKHIEA